MDAVLEIGVLQSDLRGRDRQACRGEIPAVNRVLAGIEPRQDRVRIARIPGQRDGHDEERAIVDVLRVHPEPPPVELTRGAHADLPAFVGAIARIADAVRDAVEAADAERPIAYDRAAPPAVGLVEA